MADDELEAIRARRMAELQQQQQGGDGGAQAQAEQRAKQEEMKNVILGQVLEQAARTRLNTIAVAKPEKAKMVESLIIQMARSGQLQGQKLSEQALIGLLEQVSSSTQKKTTVKFDRRRINLDDEDDDF
ncbi:programmed cell death protein 5 [Aplysia californica]|uniref:Programmed cell death protein 5 n=1 Tax=Aplysia californica TaxID=6500 RepID=A0ABM0K3K0_APLCA|nr:programmed cell death protein 5 [Aplysia californica]